MPTAIGPDVLHEIATLRELAQATFTFNALRALVRTRVFDHLDGEPRPIDDVAARAGVDSLALRRILRVLEPAGYVRVTSDGAASDRAAQFRSDSPLWPSLAHRGSADVASAMDHSLRTGTSAWEHLHGQSFFAWLEAHPDQERMFATSMRNEGTVLNLVAVPSIDLSGASSVADVGGVTGSLLAALLDANPNVRGILLDLDSVLRNVEPALLESGRCELVAGDLFGPMPTADAYVLARVLHDWSDDDCERILRGIRAAAAPGAQLFDLDLVVPTGPDAHPAKVSDLGMMLLFGGGRERTRDEFAELFGRTGWRLEDVIELPMSSLVRATAV